MISRERRAPYRQDEAGAEDAIDCYSFRNMWLDEGMEHQPTFYIQLLGTSKIVLINYNIHRILLHSLSCAEWSMEQIEGSQRLLVRKVGS